MSYGDIDYIVIAENKTLPTTYQRISLRVTAYGIRTALSKAYEIITNKYKIEPFAWEVLSIYRIDE